MRAVLALTVLLAAGAQAAPPAAVPVLMYHIIGAAQDEPDCLRPPLASSYKVPHPAPPAPPEAVQRCRALATGLGAPLKPEAASAPSGSPAANPALAHMTVSAAEFKRQMRWLKDHGWRTLSLGQLFDPAARFGPRDVALTFDDGYEDNYTEALPVLRALGLKASLFMVSDNVGRPGRLSADQLLEMDAADFRVYAHTKSHPALPTLAPEAQCVEMLASKLALEELLGREVAFFAYPYGRFTPGVTDRLAREAGFTAAFSVRAGRCDPRGAETFTCQRLGVSDAEPGSFEDALGLPKGPEGPGAAPASRP